MSDTETATRSESRAIVGTLYAHRYLQQLCKHWAHRFEIESGPSHGRIKLPLGEVLLSAAADALTIELAVERPDDLPTMREVVVRHVDRFAFRETLRYQWSEPSGLRRRADDRL